MEPGRGQWTGYTWLKLVHPIEYGLWVPFYFGLNNKNEDKK